MKNRVNEIKKAKGLSFRDISANVSIDNSALAKFANGKENLSAHKLIELADYFNVSLDYLLMRTERDLMNENVPPQRIQEILASPEFLDLAHKELYELCQEIEGEDIEVLISMANTIRKKQEILRKEIENKKKGWA